MFQFQRDHFAGIEREPITIERNQTQNRKIVPLPDNYSEVPPAVLHTKKPNVPVFQGPDRPEGQFIPNAKLEESQWLQEVRELIKKEELVNHDYISWAAYHASQQPPICHHITINALLPLFYECSHTVEMIKHGMDVVSQAV